MKSYVDNPNKERGEEWEKEAKIGKENTGSETQIGNLPSNCSCIFLFIAFLNLANKFVESICIKMNSIFKISNS